MDEDNKSYYSVIPAYVRYDKDLKDKAKLLYGEITSLCNDKGYCWATNEYFANLFGVTKTTISLLIKDLIQKKYIYSQIIYKEGSKEILNRYLSLVKDPIKEILNSPIKENLKENNISINNKINNKEIKKENKNSCETQLDIVCKEVIDYMNNLAGTSFKHTTQKTRTLIKARLKDGFDKEDLKDVIYDKYYQWFCKPFKFNNGVNSDVYFRPSTLFSNNFENYLQEYKNNIKE